MDEACPAETSGVPPTLGNGSAVYIRAFKGQIYRNDHHCLLFIHKLQTWLNIIELHDIMHEQSMQHTGIQSYVASEHHMELASSGTCNQSAYQQGLYALLARLG